MADNSLKALMRDKRVQLAAAGVGGVGLVVMLMRRGGGGGPAAGQAVIQPAARLDTTNGDLYNALQSLGQGWQNDLRSFNDTLTNVEKKLPTTPTKMPFMIRQGENIATTAERLKGLDPGLTVDALVAQNPDLKGYLRWANAGGYVAPSNPNKTNEHQNWDVPGGSTLAYISGK